MKILTSNQLKFGISFLILTILINTGITLLLNSREFSNVWILVPVFIIAVLITGWFFGKKDNENLPLLITGFKFHLITYLITNSIALLKHLLGLASIYEKINTVYLTLIFWGLGLLLHFIIYQIKKGKTIKGIKQSEIFE